MVVDTRTSASWLTSRRAVTPAASGRPTQLPWRTAAGAAALALLAGSTTKLVSVFQAPQSPHWPCHWVVEEPHSLQT